MFPEFCKLVDSIGDYNNPEFDTVPAYRKLSLEDSGNNKLTFSTIKSINHNSYGFIVNNEVNYRLCDFNSYYINMNDKFVYAYFAGEYYKDTLPVLMILEFLKFKANKIMFVFEDNYFVLEKTKATYLICEKLDEIYSSSSYLHNVLIKSISKDEYEMIFHRLIEIFSMRYRNKDSRNMNIIDVMLKILKLEIS